MKTTISRVILVIFTFVTLAVFISFTNNAASIQTAAICQQQAGPMLPANAYSDLLNSLFTN